MPLEVLSCHITPTQPALLVAFNLTREDSFPGDVCQHFIVFIAGERQERNKCPKSLSYVLYSSHVSEEKRVGALKELAFGPFVPF